MEIGDVIRTRNIRAYFAGPEARGWAEFVADKERKRENKTVFVLLFLGMEKLVSTAVEALDVKRQLNALGYWGEDQLGECMSKKALEELVRELIERVNQKGGTDDAKPDQDPAGSGA